MGLMKGDTMSLDYSSCLFEAPQVKQKTALTGSKY